MLDKNDNFTYSQSIKYNGDFNSDANKNFILFVNTNNVDIFRISEGKPSECCAST
jgi:hypothetical protein